MHNTQSHILLLNIGRVPVPSTDTRTVLFGYTPMVYLFDFLFLFLQRVHAWYSRGTQIQKNAKFFPLPFSFIRFFYL
jgi:hypothetical protein